MGSADDYSSAYLVNQNLDTQKNCELVTAVMAAKGFLEASQNGKKYRRIQQQRNEHRQPQIQQAYYHWHGSFTIGEGGPRPASSCSPPCAQPSSAGVDWFRPHDCFAAVEAHSYW